MLTIELMGGLGNQLFQIFTLIAYAKKYNQPFLIEKKTSLPGQYVTRNVYWGNLLDKLSDNLVQTPLDYPFIHEKSFEYNEFTPIPQDPNKINNFKLHGYFQSYKYFQEYKNEILNELDWNTKRYDVLQKLRHKDVNNMISLHFRIGDYAKLQNYHPIMTVEYYTNAIKTIQEHIEAQKLDSQKLDSKENMRILYFCEDNDKPFVTTTFINQLKKTFQSITFDCCEGEKLDDWEQMIAMSLCKHHIIGNSSFSWWGAYLSELSDSKVVCYPDKWFGVKASDKNTSDLFPISWKKCETGILIN